MAGCPPEQNAASAALWTGSSCAPRRSSAGGQDHHVMGYTANQIIHDCLDHYERHVEFLRLG